MDILSFTNIWQTFEQNLVDMTRTKSTTTRLLRNAGLNDLFGEMIKTHFDFRRSAIWRSDLISESLSTYYTTLGWTKNKLNWNFVFRMSVFLWVYLSPEMSELVYFIHIKNGLQIKFILHRNNLQSQLKSLSKFNLTPCLQ